LAQTEAGQVSDRPRIGVSASFTAEAIEPYLGVGLVDAGFAAPIIEFAPLNQIFQTALDPTAMFDGAPDHIGILWRIEDVFAADFELFLLGDDDAASRIVGGAEELVSAVAEIPSRHGIDTTVGIPPFPFDASGDLTDPATSVRLGALHRRTVDVVVETIGSAPGCALVDLDAIQRSIGTASGFDVTKWMLYRQPYAPRMLRAVGQAIATSIVRSVGPTPKVLALDCDGTLWGGIVGEDGLAGIELGQDFPGRAYSEFQKACQRLQRSGVMLVVVSKNNHDDVMEVFDNHDAMVLRPDDITAWRVNWEPKSQNLQSLADELNVGIDSFVFIDDNQHEIAEVEARAPQVATLLVPEDPEHLPGLLAASGLFRDMRTTAVDAKRTSMMLEQKSRDAARGAMGEADFLDSLEMVVEYFPVAEGHLARATQLIAKTNQFNLTTRRRTDAEVAALAKSDHHLVRAVRVTDRFGDYGLVGVAIVDTSGGAAQIDTLLLSCRALGRGVETAFLAAVAAEVGERPLRGEHIPRQKNVKTADFYATHGFADLGGGWFELGGQDSVAVPGHIDLRSEC
jgi:FkbH-like protein